MGSHDANSDDFALDETVWKVAKDRTFRDDQVNSQYACMPDTS